MLTRLVELEISKNILFIFLEHLTDFEETINLEEIEAKPAQDLYEIE